MVDLTPEEALAQLQQFDIPALPKDYAIVGKDGRPDPKFMLWWQKSRDKIDAAVTTIASIVSDLSAAVDDIQDARARAATIAEAQRTGDSSVSGLTITPGANSITISSHTRTYREPNVSVAVTGNTVSGLSGATTYYIFYEDAGREGGAVSYQVTTTIEDANPSLDTPYRHFVGKAVTGGAATNIGAAPWRRGLT